ncbi:hypothetical protein [Fructobacillus parabroussonetiae]|uniref:Uncharacterized protein n=1 Tax=Fructobacillus parabroussonetiae TaxID=2713174 RepID=A0ABS5QV28_9LACO|nr:hypothetical protein [Fructobacillus parabroussonetiae]MBS9337053.1 hypothetical protein [Fructobacillus parabroussonetiae]
MKKLLKRRPLIITAFLAIVLAGGSGFGYQQIQGSQQKPNRSKSLTTKKSTAPVEQTADQNKQDDQQKNADQNQTEENAQADNQQSASATDNNSAADATATTSASTSTSSVAAPRTDGFNFLGQHFDITTFSNTTGGNTPRWTPYIFQWSAMPNYYLAEAASSAGSAVRQLSYGTEAVINGRTYHVTEIRHGMKRLDSLETVQDLAGRHALGIQTCDDASGNYVSTYWFD